MSDNRPKHDLLKFLSDATKQMASDYEWIQRWSTEDHGTAGEQGQENWAGLLRKWLPPTFAVVTNGRLIGHDGTRSGQVDVLVLHPAYPPALYDVKHYLAGGVLAAFECKNTLKKAHLREFFSESVKIKSLVPARSGSVEAELYSPIIYGLLAHSSVFRPTKKGRYHGYHQLNRLIYELDKEIVTHPRLRPDLVCVADQATWGASHYYIDGVQDGFDGEVVYGDYPDVRTMYWAHPDGVEGREPFAIGNLVCLLLKQLSREEPSLRRIADYFDLSQVATRSIGANRLWPDFRFSPKVEGDIIAQRLPARPGALGQGAGQPEALSKPEPP